MQYCPELGCRDPTCSRTPVKVFQLGATGTATQHVGAQLLNAQKAAVLFKAVLKAGELQGTRE